MDVKETREALEFIVPFANAIDEATKDGLQWVKDAMTIAPTMIKLPAALSGASLIPAELSDLTNDEREELFGVIAGLEFNQEYAEKIGEKALAAFIALGELMVVIREAKKKE